MQCILIFLANLQSRIKKGNMNLKELGENLSLLNGVLDYESFADMDMVIEVGPNYHYFEVILLFP